MHSWRIILLPFSWLYGLITFLRNKLFDWNVFSSYVIPNKSIVVGNITVGGTGKSPMTAYLIDLLRDKHPAVLSRGYGRATKGPRLANDSDNASTIGDEPLMYYRRFEGNVPVVVAEERKKGVELINEHFPDSIILLDDAYQHRKVKAGFQLLLMTCDRPIFRDFPFPAGNLRESRSGINRADAVVITKCPEGITGSEKADFAIRLAFQADRVFFSSIKYGSLTPLFKAEWPEPEIILLVTGIANPEPLKKHLEQHYEVVSMTYPDHHSFTPSDIQTIQQKVATFASRRYALVTTEKDAVRLAGLASLQLTAVEQTPGFADLPWFVQQMTISIDREDAFKQLVNTYVNSTDQGSR